MLKVVSLVPLGSAARGEIENTDPSIELHMAAGWFDGELRATWGDQTADSYLGTTHNIPPRAERDEMLAVADVILGGFPVPVDLVARAPRLRWFHQTPAGASNLHRCDLWGQRRCCDNLSWSREHPGDRRVRGGVVSPLRERTPPGFHRSGGRRVRPSVLSPHAAGRKNGLCCGHWWDRPGRWASLRRSRNASRRH